MPCLPGECWIVPFPAFCMLRCTIYFLIQIFFVFSPARIFNLKFCVLKKMYSYFCLLCLCILAYLLKVVMVFGLSFLLPGFLSFSLLHYLSVANSNVFLLSAVMFLNLAGQVFIAVWVLYGSQSSTVCSSVPSCN